MRAKARCGAYYLNLIFSEQAFYYLQVHEVVVNNENLGFRCNECSALLLVLSTLYSAAVENLGEHHGVIRLVEYMYIG